MNMNKKIKNIISLSILSILMSVNISNADSSVENELKEILNKYQNASVENGIVLEVGESLDLSKYIVETSNENLIKVNEDNSLEAIRKGTTFLTVQDGDNLHVLEVFVDEEDPYKLINSVNSRQTSNQYKVFIDAGHGGTDPGAVTNGLQEADLNLKVALLVEQKLKDKGIEVLMSRTTDVYHTLNDRAVMSNLYNPHVFVSIHHNSATATSASGIETYHHTDKVSHKPLSTEIQNETIRLTGANSRGVKSANFSVLRNTTSVSSLFEGGFMSNVNESKNLGNPAYQDKLATGIVNGIENYLKANVVLNPTPEVEPEIEDILPDTEDILPEVEDNVFNDLQDHWAKDYILDFADKDIIGGYEDNTFRPDNSITRAEFIKIVNRVFGFTKTGEVKFDDLSPREWFYYDVELAVGNRYISGYEDNTFRPNNPITREEASAVIANIVWVKGDGVLSFIDEDQIAPWAKPSVDALNDNNIIGGYEDNTFRPKSLLTRAETVVILSRVL